jgi:nitronate monooxygenase
MAGLRTPLCDLLGIEVPILQAGMGRGVGSTTSVEMVAAVSNAGGLGCLGGTGFNESQLREQIAAIRALTDKPFGVDLLIPANLADSDVPREGVREHVRQNHPQHWKLVRELYEKFDLDPQAQHPNEWAISPTLMRRQAEVVVEEKVPVFVSALGDPGWITPDAHAAGIVVMGISGSPRNAARQVQAGVDVVIAQGTEAGGHTGTIATLPLVPQIVDQVSPIPVVAAGGIADGRGVAAALALGAQGVWVGSAYLFSHEANLHEPQREQLQRAQARDMIAGTSYTGKPSRIYYNEVARTWADSGLEPLPMPYQTVIMDDFNHAAELAGRYELIQNPGGQIVGLLEERRSAADITRTLAADAAKVIAGIQQYA